jgi:hypothetical protein
VSRNPAEHNGRARDEPQQDVEEVVGDKSAGEHGGHGNDDTREQGVPSTDLVTCSVK